MSLAIGLIVLLQLSTLAAGLGARLARGAPPAWTVGLVRALLLVAVLAPLLGLVGPEHAFRVAAPAAHLASEARALTGVASTAPAAARAFPWEALLVAAWALVFLGRVTGEILRLARLLRGLTLRRVGRVRVLASLRARVPLSAATPGRRWVLLDAATLADERLARVALAHEATHHRRGDPLWAWFELVVGAAAPLSALLWRPVLDEAVELACDARLARRLGARGYARSLLQAAEHLAQVPALARPAWANSLNRRILMLLKPSFSPLRALLALSLGLPLTLGVGLAADLRPPVGGAALTDALREVSDTGFVVPEHPVVQRALQHFVESPKGRAFVAKGLRNRAVYGTLVDGALADAGLPASLAAIPLIESSYESFDMADGRGPASMAPGSMGAGLWMFIPSTARSYGLRVDETVDERLDVVRETDAAVRLLTDLHARYDDWPLAIAAYNMGEKAVDRAIVAGGTRDAWALVEAGQLNDYLALVGAGAVVMQRPEWVE